jgi:hypothetical protein
MDRPSPSSDTLFHGLRPPGGPAQAVTNKFPTLPEVRLWMNEALNLRRRPHCSSAFTRTGIVIDSYQHF